MLTVGYSEEDTIMNYRHILVALELEEETKALIDRGRLLGKINRRANLFYPY